MARGCACGIWTGVLRGWVDGALTGYGESDVEEQKLTPRAPLICRLAALSTYPLKMDRGLQIDRRERRIVVHVGHRDDPEHWP